MTRSNEKILTFRSKAMLTLGLFGSVTFSVAITSNRAQADMNSFSPIDRSPEVVKMNDSVERAQGPAELDAEESFSHFLYLGNDEAGYRRLNKVQWIGRRTKAAFPGQEVTAYADEFLFAVAVHQGNLTLFVQLMPYNLARVRCITPQFDRLASIKYADKGPKRAGPHAFSGVLTKFRYGPYFVVMNASGEESFEFDVPEDMRDTMLTELQAKNG